MPPSSGIERQVEGGFGAYGLRLVGVEAARELLGQAEPDWPTLRLTAEVGPVGQAPELVTDERAELLTRSGVRIEIERGKREATFRARRALTPGELVHPHLAPAAAVVSRWFGRESFHAGAFAVGDDAWAMLGERESGKSSTLAALSLRGVRVLTDDMLILDGVLALAGPRCIDLRPETAEALGAGELIGKAGDRERWRLPLASSPGRPRLRGIVFLDWGERLEAEPVAASRRLAGLLHFRGLRLPAVRPELLLELAELPAWELRRPRGLASLPDALDRLLDFVAG